MYHIDCFSCSFYLGKFFHHQWILSRTCSYKSRGYSDIWHLRHRPEKKRCTRQRLIKSPTTKQHQNSENFSCNCGYIRIGKSFPFSSYLCKFFHHQWILNCTCSYKSRGCSGIWHLRHRRAKKRSTRQHLKKKIQQQFYKHFWYKQSRFCLVEVNYIVTISF